MDERAVAVGVGVLATFVAAAATSMPGSSRLVVLGIGTLVGLYWTLAAILRIRPFHRLRVSAADLLDDCIREGQQALRELLLRGELDPPAQSRIAAGWFQATANRLHESYPARTEEFLGAAGDQSQHFGRALLIETIALKLRVLQEARVGL